MLFTSFEFIFLFLPITVAVFFLISRLGHQLGALWLGVASLFFYGWWNPRFVLLLLASILFNYAVGYAIGHRRAEPGGMRIAQRLLVFGVAADLILLGVFKYFNFFVATINNVSGAHWITLDVVLPLGISFFTFTQIAFLVDVKRGIAREYNFIHYLLFVTYFPHLIAGPVLHHKQMMPQFGDPKIYSPRSENFSAGLALFALGLMKKILLADSFAEYASPVFNVAEDGVQPDFYMAWLGALAYTLQLYFDFSGYSDMAIGLSRMIGVNLPINFNSPYKSTNIIEFWRRWHMTLSQFLRDYLYISLGGNRYGKGRRYFNLMATMALGGLWHGANWTFVVWGVLHGFYLVVNHAWHGLREMAGWPPGRPTLPGRVIATLLTFLSVVVAWVFFRANSIESALLMIEGMYTLPREAFSVELLAAYQVPQDSPTRLLTLFTMGLGIVFLAPNSQEIGAWLRQPALLPRFAAIGALAVVVIALACINFSLGVSEFIYFNF